MQASSPSAGKTNRFSTISDESCQQLLVEKDAVNTHRATYLAVRTFTAYFLEKGLKTQYEN